MGRGVVLVKRRLRQAFRVGGRWFRMVLNCISIIVWFESGLRIEKLAL